ncbi:MAG: DNA repair protein RecO [Chloroflexi bacterium]|nr:DNA repair protein RecO [Chloroflexota bacterium]
MSRPRTYQTEAIIIKKTRLGEADRILTLYTPDLGKIQGVAKGVRRPKSKLAGHLEMLTHSTVSFARGRNLDTIIGSQTINSFLPLKSDIDRTARALYLVELVNQFTAEHVEDRRLFWLLLETMQQLCLPENNELLLRYFELHLLDAAGYRPQLQQCVHCRHTLTPVVNYFSPGGGGVLCPDCRHSQNTVYHLSVDALKVIRWLQDNDLSSVIRLKTDFELSRELEKVMREYIKHLLEREIKSAAWLDSLKELPSPSSTV